MNLNLFGRNVWENKLHGNILFAIWLQTASESARSICKNNLLICKPFTVGKFQFFFVCIMLRDSRILFYSDAL